MSGTKNEECSLYYWSKTILYCWFFIYNLRIWGLVLLLKKVEIDLYKYSGKILLNMMSLIEKRISTFGVFTYS